MHLRRLALMLFLIATPVFAAEPMDLTFAVPMVAVIVGIFLALMTMLATAISDPRLEAWAKTELREMIFALLLIVVIIAFFIGSSGISVALTGKTDYIGAADDIMDGWLANYDSAFENVIRAATRIRAAATYSPYINIPIWYFSINYAANPLGGVAILLGTLNMATQGLTNAIFLGEGIRMLLSFLKATVPKILLPLAFIIRLIPFTRRLGNTLIAISIAGMVFLPFSVILADELNKAIDFPVPRINLGDLDANPWAMVVAEPFCESMTLRALALVGETVFAMIVCLPLLLTPWTAAYYPVCVTPIMSQWVYPLIMLVFQVIESVLLLLWMGVYTPGSMVTHDYANTVFNAVQPFLRDINNLVLVGYLDFILIGVVTIVGARSLSSALGGEWYMAGIQRLI